MKLKEFYKSIPLFKMLDDNEIQLIIDAGVVKNYGKGDTIHTPYEVCTNISIILEGKVYSAKYSLSGKEQILCNFDKGKMFGFPVVFGDLTYPEYLITETACKIAYIHRDVLLELFNNKQLLMTFIEKLSKKIKEFSEKIEILSYTSVRERVAKYLLSLYIEQKSKTISLTKNKTRLAKELGSVRVVVSRAFKTLEDLGVIEQIDENRIRILKLGELEGFV